MYQDAAFDLAAWAQEGRERVQRVLLSDARGVGAEANAGAGAKAGVGAEAGE